MICLALCLTGSIACWWLYNWLTYERCPLCGRIAYITQDDTRSGQRVVTWCCPDCVASWSKFG